MEQGAKNVFGEGRFREGRREHGTPDNVLGGVRLRSRNRNRR